jgi:Fe2+ or Zn2+ uptake regulation protein
MKHYHETTTLAPGQLEIFKAKAKSQTTMIKSLFQRHPEIDLTASQVWQYFKKEGKEWPLTSVRRSLSNLQKAGFLVRIEDTRPGIYGAPEHYYRVR